MTISMTQIWDESLAFIRRESTLLIPLALATLGIGDAGTSLAVAQFRTLGNAAAPGWLMLALLASVTLSLIGQLAIVALAVGKDVSVGEALRISVVRLPKLLLISLVLGVMLFVSVLPLAITLASQGYDVSTANPQLPFYASFYLMVVFGLLIWFGVRMITLNAVVIDRNPPLIEAVQSAYRLTKGRYLPILGVLLLYLIVLVVLTSAIGSIVGVIFAVVGKMIGSPFVGQVMAALATAQVAATLGLISNVYIARLYQALSAAAPSKGI